MAPAQPSSLDSSLTNDWLHCCRAGFAPEKPTGISALDSERVSDLDVYLIVVAELPELG